MCRYKELLLQPISGDHGQMHRRDDDFGPSPDLLEDGNMSPEIYFVRQSALPLAAYLSAGGDLLCRLTIFACYR